MGNIRLVSLLAACFLTRFFEQKGSKQGLTTFRTGSDMEKQWTGKNVNLALFSRNVADFLQVKGYRTVSKESGTEHRISATLQGKGGLTGVLVRVYGEPDDFVVEIDVAKEARLSKILGSVTGLFGGGSLILRGLKSEEALQELEEEFWLFAEETVTRLVDSNKR